MSIADWARANGYSLSGAYKHLRENNYELIKIGSMKFVVTKKSK